MDWFSHLAIACALAMDAFAVAIVTGLTLDQLTRRHVFRLAFHFGILLSNHDFKVRQPLMPLCLAHPKG
jgi:putative Mn2+ efflux pump MntP